MAREMSYAALGISCDELTSFIYMTIDVLQPNSFSI